MFQSETDWCDMAWHPVTGCFYECEYCYARRKAHQFPPATAKETGEIHDLAKPVNTVYPFGFDPTFHRCRLTVPLRFRNPKTISVCSMSDLFGEWVPDEWIESVLKACHAAPWHRYLYLTRNVHAYDDFEVPDRKNHWYGQTWDGKTTGLTDYNYHGHRINQFLSIDPILSGTLPIDSIKSGHFGWVIVGAETGSHKWKVVPERAWIESVVSACRVAGVPVFIKENLRGLMGSALVQEFPWEDTQ